jgi:hypothetical protein
LFAHCSATYEGHQHALGSSETEEAAVKAQTLQTKLMNNARTKLQHETRQINVRKIINAITDSSTTTLAATQQHTP